MTGRLIGNSEACMAAVRKGRLDLSGMDGTAVHRWDFIFREASDLPTPGSN
jgi:hypothetical protein